MKCFKLNHDLSFDSNQLDAKLIPDDKGVEIRIADRGRNKVVITTEWLSEGEHWDDPTARVLSSLCVGLWNLLEVSRTSNIDYNSLIICTSLQRLRHALRNHKIYFNGSRLVRKKNFHVLKLLSFINYQNLEVVADEN